MSEEYSYNLKGLYIPSFSLEEPRSLRFTVTLLDLSKTFLREDQLELNFVREPIKPMIIGGNKTVPAGIHVLLDGSYSRDPNWRDFNSSFRLGFDWSCSKFNSDFTESVPCDLIFEARARSLLIATDELEDDEKYSFTMVIDRLGQRESQTVSLMKSTEEFIAIGIEIVSGRIGEPQNADSPLVLRIFFLED